MDIPDKMRNVYGVVNKTTVNPDNKIKLENKK